MVSSSEEGSSEAGIGTIRAGPLPYGRWLPTALCLKFERHRASLAGNALLSAKGLKP
jgi:hypothetical protein